MIVLLDGSSLTIDALVAIADRGEQVALSDQARTRVNAARTVVDERAQGREPAYGIKRGWGPSRT